MLLNQLTFSWVKKRLQPDSSYIMQNSVYLIVISKMSAFESYVNQYINTGLLSRLLSSVMLCYVIYSGRQVTVFMRSLLPPS